MDGARVSRRYIAAAVSKMQRGDHRGAIVDWLEAIKLQPNHPEIHTGFEALGTCYANTGELDKAEEAYREAIRRNADFPQAHAGLGNILVTRHRFSQAMDEYKLAIDGTPGRDDLRRLVRTGLTAIIRLSDSPAVKQRAQLLIEAL